MKIDGNIVENLKFAVRSSRRLKGHPVHKDTLEFWGELIAFAREEKRNRPEGDWSETDVLIAAMEEELLQRSRD